MIFTLFALSAEAQLPPPPPVQIPYAPPDLVMTINVPAQVPQNGTALVELTVNNPLTPGRSTTFGAIMSGSTVNDVVVFVRFSGLEPLTIQGDSGFQCSAASVAQYAICSGGVLSAGGAATIRVSVKEHGNCGTDCAPVYVDAQVDQANATTERLETNNRALAVIDVLPCIN